MDHLSSRVSLLIVSFLAATILPGSSEILLATLAFNNPDDRPVLFAVATFGNTAGAAVNWALGKWFMHFSGRRWFPVSPKHVETASRWFRKYGIWSLLFSWLPIVGDPLTVVAGALHVRFFAFLALVATGKALRYLLVLWGTDALRFVI
jgi:membrane protein YqaA with SNARE-associated domain